MWTGCVLLGMYNALCCLLAAARCSRARLSLPISVASPCTSTTCLGCSWSMNSLVWGKSAWAEKLIASTPIRKGTCQPREKYCVSDPLEDKVPRDVAKCRDLVFLAISSWALSWTCLFLRYYKKDHCEYLTHQGLAEEASEARKRACQSTSSSLSSF